MSRGGKRPAREMSTNETTKRSKLETPAVPKPPRDWDRWVSASSTRNYLINDPLLDYLVKYHYQLSSKKKEYVATISKAINRRGGSFMDYIMEKGQEFEGEVMRLLHRKLPNGVIVNIGGNINARDPQKVKDTMAAMNKGVPVIYSGVLHDEELEVYGVPDLLVRCRLVR